LIEQLREFRLECARERSVPAYVIFTYATMEALAEMRPDSEESLLAISGIGPDKVSRYGEQLITLISTAVSDADADADAEADADVDSDAPTR